MENYKELLILARKTLENYFKNKTFDSDEYIKKKYSEKKACFVTLTKNKNLRGCVGSLEPRQELWKDIQENAINAGFHDFRFPPLNKEELNKIKIEISVLSKPKKLGKGKEIFDKITKDMGLILEKQNYLATFLPQVWVQIPNKEVFLENLSLKAGLNKDDWKTADISFYTVKKIKEN